MTIVISIEGNIGVGKTTLLNCLKNIGLPVLLEPIPDETLMARFYSDPKKYGLEVQLNFLNKRMQTLIDFLNANQHRSLVFIDRSIMGDLAFAKNVLSDKDMEAYLHIRDAYIANYPKLIPDYSIVIKAPSTEVELERIKRRNSSYEVNEMNEDDMWNYLIELDRINDEVFPKDKCPRFVSKENETEELADTVIIFALSAMFLGEDTVPPISYFLNWT